MNQKALLLCCVLLALSAPLCWADTSHPWHNDVNPLDVDANGHVAPLDVLIIVNKLNSGGGGPVPLGPQPLAATATKNYYDTTGDNKVTALDALVVVNGLNSGLTTPNPEPGSIVMGAFALAAFIVYAYRRRRLADKVQLVPVPVRTSRTVR